MLPSSASIVLLNSTSQLLQTIPLSSVTVLLFTALWSAESQHARNALTNATEIATKLSSCDSSIQLYELSWPPRMHAEAKPSVAPSLFSWNALLNAGGGALLNGALLNAAGDTVGDRQRSKPGSAHSNITSQVPWLPCIQLFTKDMQHTVPFTYKGSFDQYAIAAFLQRHCSRIPKSRGNNSTADVPNSMSGAMHDDGSNGIVPLSRDGFAKAITTPHAMKPYGILVLVPRGLHALREDHRHTWGVITSVVNSTNTELQAPVSQYARKPPWVVTIVDTLLDANFMQRLRADHKAQSGISVLLVNPKSQYTHFVELGDELLTAEEFSGVLQDFRNARGEKISSSRRHRHQSKSNGVNNRDRATLVLSYFDEPKEWKQYFAPPQSTVSLKNWLKASYDGEQTSEQAQGSVALLIVYETWCAFCQRILPVYHRFSSIVESTDVDVHAVMIQGCARLHPWLDEMVDGFPTVLLLRQVGHWSSVEEYRAPHSIEQLTDHLDVHTGQVLRDKLNRF